MKRVLLIIGGGIAAYKSLELIRRLQDAGYQVRGVLTAAAQQFITPLSVAALTADNAFTDLFSLKDEAEMGHIRLSREADLLLVAPATADLMAKMATGRADDLATTIMLATDKPAMIAPSMNVMMWQHKATQRNLARLVDDGIMVIQPGSGDLACGEVGSGRLAEVPEIVARVDDFFHQPAASRPLAGRRVLVTAGPTHEPIDPVRYIANRSSGKQGYAIAAALAALGAETALISGPTSLPDPKDATVTRVETGRQMLAAVEAALPVDIAIFTAAVCDWRSAEEAPQKRKKDGSGTVAPLALMENPDILASIAQRPHGRPSLVIGFAAETEHVIAHARAKRTRKGCDWIVANDVTHAERGGAGVMGADHNHIHLIIGEDDAPIEVAGSKAHIAAVLAQQIADAVTTAC